MQLKKCLIPLIACAMLQPLCVGAEQVVPDSAVELAYSVGELEIQFDRNCNGAIFSVYRIQPEGEFQYYSYQAKLADASELVCPLIEGNYQLTVSLPDTDAPGWTTEVYAFAIPDPDMDKTQSFDRTVQVYTFTTNPELTEDSLTETDLKNTDRTLYRSVQCTLARQDFMLGDVDGDCSVSIDDASIILAEIAGSLMGEPSHLTALQAVEGDVNGDGSIDTSDASEVLLFTATMLMGSFDGDMLDFERQYIAPPTPPMPEQ